MKTAINLLQEHVRSYQNMIDLYESDHHNQAVTEYTAKEAKKTIEEFNIAIGRLQKSQPIASNIVCDYCFWEKKSTICIDCIKFDNFKGRKVYVF